MKKRIAASLLITFIAAIITILYGVLVYASKTTIILIASIGIWKLLRYGILVGAGVTVGAGIISALNLFKNLKQKQKDKLGSMAMQKEISGNPVKRLVYEIDRYITDSKSTDFFVKNLEMIAVHLPEFQKRVESIKDIVCRRFGENTISYNEFISPVESLYLHSLDLVNDLIEKLYIFDEDKYSLKISELRKENRFDEVAEYEEVLQHYMQYVKDIIASFEKTVLRLDKLILEISKLNDEQLRRQVEIISDLDKVIANTKLYKG
jgi:hypothetical protein